MHVSGGVLDARIGLSVSAAPDLTPLPYNHQTCKTITSSCLLSTVVLPLLGAEHRHNLLGFGLLGRRCAMYSMLFKTLEPAACIISSTSWTPTPLHLRIRRRPRQLQRCSGRALSGRCTDDRCRTSRSRRGCCWSVWGESARNTSEEMREEREGWRTKLSVYFSCVLLRTSCWKEALSSLLSGSGKPLSRVYRCRKEKVISLFQVPLLASYFVVFSWAWRRGCRCLYTFCEVRWWLC